MKPVNSLGEPGVQTSDASPPLPCESEALDQGLLDVGERVGLMGDGLMNYAGFIVSGVVGIALVPLFLRRLGAESYGTWAVAATVGAWAASILDFGLFFSISREIAARDSSDENEEAAKYALAGANVYLLTGVVGAIAIAALGIPIVRAMKLPASSYHTSLIAFALIGLTFLTGQLAMYSTAVLRGLRRFDLSSAIAGCSAILWGAGAVAVLALHGGLLGILTWQLVSSAIATGAGLLTVARIEPALSFRLMRPDWTALRRHLAFSVTSQLSSAMGSVILEATPLLVGTMLGAAQVVPYYIARKAPIAVSWISWHASEVLFFAASGSTRQKTLRGRDIIELGTRWNLVLVVPLCVVLLAFAPELLHAWVGKIDPATVGIMRFITIAMIADAVAMPSMNVLWGRGRAGTLLVILIATAVIEVGLTLWLLPRVGVIGTGWAALAAFGFAAVALVRSAAAECDASLLSILFAATRELLVPIACCATIAFLLAETVSTQGTASLGLSVLATCLTYYVAIWLCGARDEERFLLLKVRKLSTIRAGYLYRRALRLLPLRNPS